MDSSKATDEMQGFTVAIFIIAGVTLLALLKPLARLAGRLLVIASTVAIFAVLAGAIANGIWNGSGLLAGMVAALLSIGPAAKLAFAGSSPSSGHIERAPPAPARPNIITAPVAECLEPAGDEPLVKAWERAAQLSPEHDSRLSAARQECARLLSLEKSSATLDPDIIETCALIRRHVPPLVEQTERACDHCPPAEAAIFRTKLIGRLESFAGRAGELLADARKAAREELDIRHAHVEARLGGGVKAVGHDPLWSCVDSQTPDPLPTEQAGAGWWQRLVSPFARRA